MSSVPRSHNMLGLEAEVACLPKDDREDALQEAWLAHLSGRSPARAVGAFAKRERRHRRREVVSGFLS